MLTSPYQKYQQSAVQTASPSQLILMAYDGTVKFVKLGIDGIENRKFDKANLNLCKAQAIINELISSLNMDYDISNDLLSIYDYMNNQLVQANIKKNTEPAKEVLEYLKDLRTSWETAGKASLTNSGATHA